MVRSSLSAALGTVAYMLLIAVLLVLPTSAPHAPRSYLTEYHLTLGRRVVADVLLNIAIFVPIGCSRDPPGRRPGLE